MRVGLALLLSAAMVSGCSDPVAELAADTCSRLEDAIVAQVGGILNRAVSEAEELGASAPELGDAMREQCPGTMGAIESLAEEDERHANLPDEVTVVERTCYTDGATGTIRNDSNVRLDIWVEADFIDDAGVVIEQGLDSVRNLAPGDSATFKTDNLGERAAKCRVRISQAFES